MPDRLDALKQREMTRERDRRHDRCPRQRIASLFHHFRPIRVSAGKKAVRTHPVHRNQNDLFLHFSSPFVCSETLFYRLQKSREIRIALYVKFRLGAQEGLIFPACRIGNAHDPEAGSFCRPERK